MKTYRLHIMLLLFVTLSAEGELRNWCLKDGQTFEAEFVNVIGNQIVLTSGNRKTHRIPRSEFSAEDLRFIELEQPPRLDINFSRNFDQKLFVGGFHDYWPRPPEEHGCYGFTVKQTSPKPYLHNLSAELFVIGLQRVANDKKFMVLDYQTTAFTLNEENKRSHTFWSNHKVVLRNFLVFGKPRGEKYHGHLVVVTDERNEIIAVQASRNWLYENLDELRGRKIGHFMDKTCRRCYPGRPDNVLWRPGDYFDPGY